MFDKLEERLGVSNLKKEITIESEKLANLKKELEIKKWLIEKSVVFSIKEFFPIIEKLLNSLYDENYQYKKVELKNTESSEYIYYLTNLSYDIVIDSDEYLEEINKGNIIVLGSAKSNKELEKVSLIAKKDDKCVRFNYSMDKEFFNYIMAFIEKIVENALFGDNKKTYEDLVNEFLEVNNSKLEK